MKRPSEVPPPVDSSGAIYVSLAADQVIVKIVGNTVTTVAGVRGQTIICNAPGSPKGAIEQIDAVLDVVPHALRLLHSEPTEH